MIVRTVAVLTALIASGFIALIGLWIAIRLRTPEYSSRLDRELIACGLLAIVPLMLIRASIQAWRLNLKGVVSISSAWLLLGFIGIYVNAVSFSRGQHIQDGMSLLMCCCGFLIGVLVSRQKRFF